MNGSTTVRVRAEGRRVVSRRTSRRRRWRRCWRAPRARPEFKTGDGYRSRAWRAETLGV